MVGCLTGVPLCYLLLRVIRNPFICAGLFLRFAYKLIQK
jgi:hypothetical protein